MNRNFTSSRPLFTLAAFAALVSTGFGQGSLTPPAGPPAPVFKTLDQVEARTPLNTLSGDSTAVHVITLPGSYYLTGPVTGNTAKAGIRIEAVNVTLDLNGFTIDAVTGSTKGITSNAPGGALVIRNGMIRNFQQGIDISNSAQFQVQDIQVVAPQGTGVVVDGQGTLERVSVLNGKSYGIDATGTSKVTIRDCRVDGITTSNSAVGIRAPQGDIRGCAITNLSGYTAVGILSSSGSVDSCLVRGVTASGSSNAATGISADLISRCTVADISNTTGTANGIVGGRSVAGTRVSTIAGNTALGIYNVGRVTDCEVSNVKGGTLRAVGVSDCDEVVGSRITGVIDSTGNSYGIDLPVNGRAVRNQLQNAGNYSIRLANYGLAEGNHVTNSSAAGRGITAAAGVTGVRIDGNHVAGLSTGIDATHTSAVVIRNTVTGVGVAYYTVHAGVTVVTATAIGTNPFANIRQ